MLHKSLKPFKYKITYLPEYMQCAFVRIADDAILYVGSEENVKLFAEGFKCGSGGTKTYYIE